MLKRLTKNIVKSCRLLFSISRKFITRPREALLLCRMAWWVGVVSVAARCYSLPRALQIVAGKEHRQASRNAAAIKDQLARTIDLLLSAEVLMFRPSCWKRAAVLHRYLSRQGITTHIMFGVRTESDGRMAGHAWLEAEGQPILESLPPKYVITYSFPSNERFDPQLASLSFD